MNKITWVQCFPNYKSILVEWENGRSEQFWNVTPEQEAACQQDIEERIMNGYGHILLPGRHDRSWVWTQ